MKTVGFIKSKKENERRRAITFEDIKKIKNRDKLVFESGYFDDFGISDEEIKNLGSVVKSRKDTLKCDIICDPKVGDAEYLDILNNQTIFGWIHATQNRHITDSIINSKLTAYAWESMFEGDKHVFWKNNQIAGEAAICHSITVYGKLPTNLDVAIIGYGNTAKGAERVLKALGANVTIYQRKDEAKFKKEFMNYNIIVNAVLWDVNRKDYILCNKDLKKMKSQSLIVDISCDHDGAIQSSRPTTANAPTYIQDGVIHYAVDHTPTFLYRDATESISKEIIKYLDLLIESKEENNKVMRDSLIIKDGNIIDENILIYQNR